VAGALRRGGNEHFRAGDQLEPGGVVLADPGLVIVEPVEMLDQFEIPLDRKRRILVMVMERRQKMRAASAGFRPMGLPAMSRLRRLAASGFAARPKARRILFYSLPAGKFSFLPAARQGYRQIRLDFSFPNRERNSELQRTGVAGPGRRQSAIYKEQYTRRM
jgi:hypothetical protein